MEHFDTMKCRTGAIHRSPSPRSVYYAKYRKDGSSCRSTYIAFFVGAICFSAWSLRGQHLSSSLHTGLEGGIWDQPGSHTNGELDIQELKSQGSSGWLLSSLRRHGLNASSAATMAAAVGTRGPSNLLAFQRSKTALPFIMMICRMCLDPVSQAMQRSHLYDPVTSTILEHALSTTPEETRVFVEIGPGTGYFSMLAASWRSDVVTFEPSATKRVLLSHNAALHRDGAIKVVPYAVGAKSTLAAIVGESASNNTSSNSSSTLGSDSSSGGPTKRYGVDVVKLSDAISGGAQVSVLMINAAALDGVSSPDVVEVAEGAHGMLSRVEWVFLLGLNNHSEPHMLQVLAGMLQHGNFSHVYCYGAPPSDDAQSQEQEAAGEQYPADMHYVDVTARVERQADATFPHDNFIFRRAPINTTLAINVPKLVWNWDMPIISGNSSNAAAAPANESAAKEAAAPAAASSAGSASSEGVPQPAAGLQIAQ